MSGTFSSNVANEKSDLLTTSLSEIEDTHLPTAVDLQFQDLAYQASLATTARVTQPSLVDFLR